MMEKNKKITLMFIGIAILVIGIIGVTYAFFNYTRTGAANNIRTGRIYFNTGQSDTINLTNVFPVSRTAAATDNTNTSEVFITITGDTSYSQGMEYLITAENVNSGSKHIPISIIVTPESSGDLGEDATNYWTQRGSSTSYYKTLADSSVMDGGRLLVGYIKPDSTGIEGTVGIRAFIDTNRIAITDTYPEKAFYAPNSNLTQEQLNECVSYLSTLNATEAFCNGTGTITRYGRNYTFQEAIDRSIINSTQRDYLVSKGIIINTYTNGTTSEWVDGRVVLTTDEWNNIQNSPLSFKIKAEANEGTWVEEAATLRGKTLILEATSESSMDIEFVDGDILLMLEVSVETDEYGQSHVFYGGCHLKKYNSVTRVYDDITASGEYGKIILTLEKDGIQNPLQIEINLLDMTAGSYGYYATSDYDNDEADNINSWIGQLWEVQ